MPLVYTDDTFKTAYDQATSDDLIAQAKAGEPILDTLNGEWFRISPEREAAARQQIADDIANAPTALEVWEQEMLRLNKVIRDDYRYWEESAAGAISQAAATRMAAQVAAAKAHRDLRPQGEA
jgi:hypothetical protein